MITNLRNEVLLAHNKAHAIKIAGWIGNSNKKYQTILSMMLGNNLREQQLAAEVYYYCILHQPNWLKDAILPMMKKIETEPTHVGLRRIFVRSLTIGSVHKKYWTRVYDFCMNLLSDPTQLVGLRSYAITVLGDICKQVPELAPELILVIEDAMRCNKPAMTSKGANTIAELRLLID